MGQEHYLAIDIGATKTLFAVFDTAGQPVLEHKIKTVTEYQQFKIEVAAVLQNELGGYKFTNCCCAVPGWIDFKNAVAIAFGVLPWQNVPIKKDLEQLLPGTKILFHNDAKLAGLSEANLIHKRYRKVLYLTFSTGIGGGVIIDGVIHPEFYNFEPGQMVFEHQGRSQAWEDFASGKALYEKYGKLASEIDDDKIWKAYAKLIALGLEELLATIQPDVVIFGGGVGAHFEKFKEFLDEDLNANKNPLVPIPPIIKAHRPEEAVIYGCYDYIAQNR